MLPLSVGVRNGAFRRIEALRRHERQVSEPSGATLAARLCLVEVSICIGFRPNGKLMAELEGLQR